MRTIFLGALCKIIGSSWILRSPVFEFYSNRVDSLTQIRTSSNYSLQQSACVQ